MKRVRIAIVVTFVSLAGVVGWQVVKPSDEPVYRGKPLSSWLKTAARKYSMPGPTYIAQGNADEAVRHAGTNAIPTLLRMLRAKDSALKLKLMDLADKQPVINIAFLRASDRNLVAAYAFEVLGTNAQSAIPALVEIVDQSISRYSQVDAIGALGSIGPPAKDAVPTLLRWAANTNVDFQVRVYAIGTLVQIRADPNLVVPALTNALLDPVGNVQAAALEALGRIGPDAKPAVPALVALLNSNVAAYFKSLAGNAVQAIDPETAAKAGITNAP